MSVGQSRTWTGTITYVWNLLWVDARHSVLSSQLGERGVVRRRRQRSYSGSIGSCAGDFSGSIALISGSGPSGIADRARTCVSAVDPGREDSVLHWVTWRFVSWGHKPAAQVQASDSAPWADPFGLPGGIAALWRGIWLGWPLCQGSWRRVMEGCE